MFELSFCGFHRFHHRSRSITVYIVNYNAFLSIKWSPIRLGGPADGILTKTVHKTLLGIGGMGVGSGWCDIRTKIKLLGGLSLHLNHLIA